MNLTLRDRVSLKVRQSSDETAEGLFSRVVVFFARRRANKLLRQTLRPVKPGRTASLSPHLLKDIGLPPDAKL